MFNAISSTPMGSEFTGGRALAVTKTKDFELGGVALGDISQGLRAKIWTGEIWGEDVVLSATGVDPTVIYTGAGITEISFSFDQSMRPALAFVQNGSPKLWYFDSVQGAMALFTDFSGVTPRLALDEKRQQFTGISDLILGYVRDSNLYYRLQRDRYLTEYLAATDVAGDLIKIGINGGLRFQFLFQKRVIG